MTVICDKCGKPFLVRGSVSAKDFSGLRCTHCGAPQWGDAREREEPRRRAAKLPRGVS